MTAPPPLSTPWHGARAHADKRPFLLARAAIMAAIRAWFAQEGFIEADVGAIQESPGAETHVAAFAVEGGWLHTSPEFAMKRLLAAGEEKIFHLGRVYRRGEAGPLHAPEFTLLEWYRAGAPYEAAMADCEAIAAAAARAVGAAAMTWAGRAADPYAPARRLTVRQAFADYAQAAPPAAGDAFSAMLVEKIEPHLGIGAPTLLYEYPIGEAALARPCPHDGALAERFELYACGVELANGYGELTDPDEQRRRFKAAMDEKERLYGERWPAPERFLEALAHMAPASGCALGLDRLAMLLSGARRISDVLW